MGVRFAREYDDIIVELTSAIQEVERFYEAFAMDQQTWSGMAEEEQRECAKTLADDVFYGLGSEPTIQLGQGTIQYDGKKHVITVNDGDKCISIVYLT